MKKIYQLLMTVAMIAGLASCSDNWHPTGDVEDDGEGRVSLASMGVEVSTAENAESRAMVDLSDFIITITNTATGEQAAQWYYKNMPEIFTLPVGNYEVTVKSHEVDEAAWAKPYYVGSKTFTIKDGELTEIGVITCVFSSIRVSIQYSDALKERLGDDCRVTVVCNDEGSLVFTPNETRSGYFEALDGSSTLVATFEGTLKGETQSIRFQKIRTDITKGTHYILTFNLKSGGGVIPDEMGTVVLSDGLVLDATITEVDIKGNITLDGEEVIPGTRPGEGGGDNPPVNPPVDPGSTPITITSNDVDFDKVNPIDGASYVVNIHADAGIAHLVVDISSTSDAFMSDLPGIGMPLNFDLAYPGSSEGILSGFGFPIGDDVKGKTDVVFDITQFVPLLAGFPGTHTFTLSVTDANNKQISKKLQFLAPEQ